MKYILIILVTLCGCMDSATSYKQPSTYSAPDSIDIQKNGTKIYTPYNHAASDSFIKWVNIRTEWHNKYVRCLKQYAETNDPKHLRNVNKYVKYFNESIDSVNKWYYILHPEDSGK